MAPVSIHADVFSLNSFVESPVKSTLAQSEPVPERVIIMQNELERQMERSNNGTGQGSSGDYDPADLKRPHQQQQSSLQTLPREAERFRRSANSARRRQWWNNVKINLFIAALLIAIILLIICKKGKFNYFNIFSGHYGTIIVGEQMQNPKS
jgi:hypothetical protein